MQSKQDKYAMDLQFDQLKTEWFKNRQEYNETGVAKLVNIIVTINQCYEGQKPKWTLKSGISISIWKDHIKWIISFPGINLHELKSISCSSFKSLTTGQLWNGPTCLNIPRNRGF